MSKVSCRDRNKNAVYADGSPKKPNWEYRFYGAPINGKPTPFSKTGFATEDEAMCAGIKAMEEYTHSGSVEPFPRQRTQKDGETLNKSQPIYRKRDQAA